VRPNVRCEGGLVTVGGYAGDQPIQEIGPPCGWKGERIPAAPEDVEPMDYAAWFARTVQAKPCPWCGGAVELIPRPA
jgi:hypothetical protein